MTRITAIAIAATVSALVPGTATAQVQRYPLESSDGLRLHNVRAEAATHQGKRAIRLTVGPQATVETETLARIDGLEFTNGVLELELAGTPGEGAGTGARGFIGIAFRLQDDMKTYDAFYLRPTNGRADDQERRNHATQYISHPEWTWQRLRTETPSRYESYVDLVPDTWTKIRIEVRGDKARLFVHDQPQPVLIVNDVKSGTSRKGGVALWIGPGTIAHFRNLTATP